MTCENCKKENKKSWVIQINNSRFQSFPEYYDEAGVLIKQTEDNWFIVYRCSIGHYWLVPDQKMNEYDKEVIKKQRLQEIKEEISAWGYVLKKVNDK